MTKTTIKYSQDQDKEEDQQNQESDQERDHDHDQAPFKDQDHYMNYETKIKT